MADFYSILAERVGETRDDPARVRQIIYEAARLALKRQVYALKQPMAAAEASRRVSDLEEAIARVEADEEARRRRDADEAGARRETETQARRWRDFEDAFGILEADEKSRHMRALDGTIIDRHADAHAAPAPPPIEESQSAPIAAESAPRVLSIGTRTTYEARRMRALEDAILGGLPIAEAPRGHGEEHDPDAENADALVASAPPDDANAADARQEAEDAGEAEQAPGAAEATDAEWTAPMHLDTGRSRGAEMQAAPRTVISVRDHIAAPRQGPRFVSPREFARPGAPDLSVEQPPRRRYGRATLWGLAILLQLAIAAMAGVSFYVAIWGPGTLTQIARNNAASQPSPAARSNREAAAPAASAALEAAPGEPAQGEPAPAPADAAEAVPAEGNQAASAEASQRASGRSAPAANATAALPFPRPPGYGIYAIAKNELIPLEPITVTPIDSRTSNLFKIGAPSRTSLPATGLAFLVYRQELASGAPDKFRVRIAARLSQSMNFDASGKAVVTSPTDTWIIREQGYDLRAVPVRESAEMVTLRYDKPEASLPPGRYELVIGGQPYDFVIAGEVTDPAQCLEGMATPRGPVFSECKSL